jgi:hypothetical protein
MNVVTVKLATVDSLLLFRADGASSGPGACNETQPRTNGTTRLATCRSVGPGEHDTTSRRIDQPAEGFSMGTLIIEPHSVHEPS